jgi:hypothetical protein
MGKINSNTVKTIKWIIVSAALLLFMAVGASDAIVGARLQWWQKSLCIILWVAFFIAFSLQYKRALDKR